jgi:hypothetical protein
MVEGGMTGIERAGNGRRTARVRARERNMAFAGKQAGGRIESNPSRAGQETSVQA